MKHNKPAYSLASNVGYSVRMYWTQQRSYVVWGAINTALRVAVPFMGIWLTKLVVDEIVNHASIAHFAWSVGGLALALAVLAYVKSYGDDIVQEGFGFLGSSIFPWLYENKLADMDYEMLENPANRTGIDKAIAAVANNHTSGCNMLRTVCLWAANVAGALLYGGIITSFNPIILALLAVSALVNWLMMTSVRRAHESIREPGAVLRRKTEYITNSLTDRAFAKDLRLYSMRDWLKSMMNARMGELDAGYKKATGREMLSNLVDGALLLLRDGAAYALLLMQLLGGQIGLGDFLLLFAAIGALSGWISGVLQQSSELLRASSELCDYRGFIDLPDKTNTGEGAPLPPDGQALGIALENVSYTYPGADAPTLSGIDLSIRPGERVAVVGLNGAGKTTLIKLICGLYHAQTGSVKLAGVDARAYNRDAYFTRFAAVFQDIHLLATSIAGNISQCTPDQTDRARVTECLRLAGLLTKVESLPQGIDTLLVREVNDTAIELSGGELQKLALARALYRDAPVILLDEPTAALDPIAESEMYQQYAKLTRGKTSIYISHRLASTRFCDRILYIEDQRILEQGTHDELMRLGGKYARMFSVQASYYEDEMEVAVHA